MASKVEKRRREIVGMLQSESIVYIKELAKFFKVTKETIRLDIDFLVDTYGFERIHGGIRQSADYEKESKYEFLEKKSISIEQKKQCAYRAIDLIHDGDCIYVDGGSTVSFILTYLNRKSNITLMTPSIAMLTKYVTEGHEKGFMDKGHEFVFIGGKVHTDILTTYGTFFDRLISEVNFDKMLISADGIDIKNGASDSDEVAYDIAKKILIKSNKVIVLADKTKFGHTKRYNALLWKEIDYLVTDKELDKKWQDHLAEKGVLYYKA